MAVATAETSDVIFELLEAFTTRLPQFDDFMALYPSSNRLELLILRIYDTYMKFCVTSVQYLGQSTTGKAILSLVFLPRILSTGYFPVFRGELLALGRWLREGVGCMLIAVLP